VTPQQAPLEFAPESREAAAFADGRLYLLVFERDSYHSRAWGGHVDEARHIGTTGAFKTVHVMSKPAGGEIRGYVVLDGKALQRLPVFHWPELDAEVERRLGMPVRAWSQPDNQEGVE